MDNKAQSTQPISDDQELAKVLAGVGAGSPAQAAADSTDVTVPPAPDPAETAVENTPVPEAPELPPVEPAVANPAPVLDQTPPALSPLPSVTAPSGELDSVKQEAITELRPLVDKLTLAPEEKFDTYLLLIRSTDDKTLIAPAHEAAKSITDETRRAQALLDIIKEIDFLSGAQPAS